MKIAHISTYVSSGGAAIATFRLHQSLMKHEGIDSAIIQKYPEDRTFMAENNIYMAEKDKSLISKVRRRLGLDVESLHERGLKNKSHKYEVISFPTSSYRLEEHPIVKEADIIHLHWIADDFLNYPTFFKNIKQPVIWTLHDINPFRGIFHFDGDKLKNPDLSNLDQKMLNVKIESVNRKDNINIVCLSDWMRQKSLQSKTFGRYHHHLIPNGLDFDRYPVIDKKKAKAETKTDNGLRNILVVGASLENEQKGFPMLFDAINKLEQNNFNLITVGHLSNQEYIRNDIQHLHIEKINSIAELNTYYSAADITVIPSKEDNLPNVMLESFANGTPIISFSNGGMAEHIKDGENGILIKGDINSDALSIAINDYLSNKYHFDNVKITKYALENFSDSIQTEKYIKLYNSILGK